MNTHRITAPIVVWAALNLMGCGQHGASRTPAEALARQVAEASGIDGWPDIRAIRFTFHADLGDKKIERKWEYDPDRRAVTFSGMVDGAPLILSYTRPLSGEPKDSLEKKVDAWYINDSYWLLFPFHLVWDTGATLSLAEGAPNPIDTQPLPRLTVHYGGNAGGYTPGDAYDLYIGPSHRIVSWVFRKGGRPEPTRVTSWDAYATFGPLTLAMDHRSPDGAFRQWFTDVAVKTTDAGDWIDR
jgi:hypothetical protein